MLKVHEITKNDVFLRFLTKLPPQYDPRDTPLGSLKFWKLVQMLANALYLCAQSMKWDETSFNTPFGTKMCKKPIFSRFSHANVWSNRAKTRYLVPRYVAQGFWTWNCICSIPLPSSFEKISEILLLRNIKRLFWCSYDIISFSVIFIKMCMK